MADSGYVVELSVEPGGMRRHDIVVVGTPEDVHEVLAVELANDDEDVLAMNAEMAFAGEKLVLWIIEAGALRARVDLRPFIRARLPGRVEAVELASAEASNGLEDAQGVSFEVDWERIAALLPPLTGTCVDRGAALVYSLERDAADTLGAESLYFMERELRWGYADLEGGGEMATPHLEAAFSRRAKRKRRSKP